MNLNEALHEVLIEMHAIHFGRGFQLNQRHERQACIDYFMERLLVKAMDKAGLEFANKKTTPYEWTEPRQSQLPNIDSGMVKPIALGPTTNGTSTDTENGGLFHNGLC